MPQVPRLQRSVSPEALPAARLTAAPTAESLGAGVEAAKVRRAREISRFGVVLGQVGGVIEDVIQKERARADEIAVLAAENELSTTSNRLLYDQDTGAMLKRGKDAFGVPEQVVAEFEAAADRIENALTTDRQKQAFRQLRLRALANVDLRVRQHTAGEIQRYEAEELNAYVQNAKNTAIANGSDPRVVAEQLKHAGQAIRRFGPDLGLGPEQIEQQLTALGTEVHVGVIEGLIAADQTAAARAYFAEVREEITGPALARVQQLVEAGTLRKRAQEETDAIIASEIDPVEQRKAAKLIEDPELRDEVLQRIEHEQAVAERDQRDRHEAEMLAATNIIERGGSYASIPDAIKLHLTLHERNALKDYALSKVQGRAVQTDPQVYYKLTLDASAPPGPLRDRFLKTPLLQYVNALSTADLKHFIDVQTKMRTGDVEFAEKALTNPKVQAQMVDDALVSMGLDPSPKGPGTKGYNAIEYERVSEFRRAVREAATRESLERQRELHDDELQSIVDRLRMPTGTRVVVDRWFWDKRGQAFAFETAQAQLADVTKIPARERRKIEAALKVKGIPITDAEVLKHFNYLLAKTRKDY